MDVNNIFAQAGGTAGIVAVLGILYKSLNGKRCRSHCCGKEMSMDIKIDEMPPTPSTQSPLQEVVVHKNNPMLTVDNGLQKQDSHA
jgi:hypothetical protein